MAIREISLADPAVAPAAVASPATLQAGPRRGGRRLDVLLWISAGWLFVVTAAAVLAPVLPLDDPTIPDYKYVMSGPSMDHPLGTDALGRDMLSRLVFGARSSLFIGTVAVAAGFVAGTLLGLVAGYFRRKVDTLIVGVIDVMLAFPLLIFLMLLVSLRGASVSTIVIGLALALTPTFTRLSRANTMAFAQREFVAAAQVQGAGRMRILLREVLPNVIPALRGYAFIVVGVAIVAEGSLSFLGLGVAPPTPSWGGMIASGRDTLGVDARIALLPSAVLFVTVLSLNLIGDSMRSRSRKPVTT